MFQSNKSQFPQKKGATVKDTSVTILTSGCHFEGKLYCRGSSRIAGRIEGHIVSEGLLIIEEEAIVKADIVAEEVVIQGRVLGKIEAKKRLELCAASQFEGDLHTVNLIVHEGARFSGRAHMPIRDNLHNIDPETRNESEKERQLFSKDYQSHDNHQEAARIMTDLNPVGSSY